MISAVQALIKIQIFWRAPPAGGSGFTFQVLATRASWLWAFHFNPSRMRFSCTKRGSENAITDAHMYAVQVSDTTMLPIAASLPGQKRP